MRVWFLLVLMVFAPATAPAAVPLFGEQPLVMAVEKNDLAAARAALLGGANVNLPLGEGQSVLMLAARQGNALMLALLIDHRADVGQADDLGNTALIHAAASGAVEPVDILLRAGAAVNATNRQGLTALMAAARAGHREVVSHLLAAGADRDQADYSGHTALDWAREARDRSVVALLE